MGTRLDGKTIIVTGGASGIGAAIARGAANEGAKQFLAQGSPGKIVNTASIAGRTGFPNFAPYSAAKAAVISLTQAGARALAPAGITVNAFAPGVVDTPLWTHCSHRDLPRGERLRLHHRTGDPH